MRGSGLRPIDGDRVRGIAAGRELNRATWCCRGTRGREFDTVRSPCTGSCRIESARRRASPASWRRSRVRARRLRERRGLPCRRVFRRTFDGSVRLCAEIGGRTPGCVRRGGHARSRLVAGARHEWRSPDGPHNVSRQDEEYSLFAGFQPLTMETDERVSGRSRSSARYRSSARGSSVQSLQTDVGLHRAELPRSASCRTIGR